MTATVTSAPRSSMEGEHLPHVHLVDVVGAEDADRRRALVGEHVEVLEDRVGAATKPLPADVLARRHRRDVVAELLRELPAAGKVLHQRARLVLGEHADLEDARVDHAGEHEIDDPVAPAERHRGLGAVAGERIEPLALTARQDHGHHRLLHRAPTIDDWWLAASAT